MGTGSNSTERNGTERDGTYEWVCRRLFIYIFKFTSFHLILQRFYDSILYCNTALLDMSW